METLPSVLDFLWHFDHQLHQFVLGYGDTVYVALFAVIFAETGLVVAPFLPGDSLLFTAGALAAAGLLVFGWLSASLLLAAIAGDTMNYLAGNLTGARVFRSDCRLLNRKHLERTRQFYERNGGTAAVIGRFTPIIRTYVPFVAGVAGVRYRRFLAANVTGWALWVGLCTICGYFWGNLPVVRQNFGFVILGIVLASLMPGLAQWAWNRRKAPADTPL